MRRSFRLTANQPALSINVDFQASAIVIDNPTGSPVFLRTGAPDIPNSLNADIVAPAASSSSHATSGRDFGAALGDPTLISSSSSALSGLFTVVVITLLDASELVPAYGSFSFLSLSLTDLYPLTTFTTGYLGPFDLGPWGGLHVLVLPAAGTGQGMCQIEVKQTSPDVGTGWSIYGQWAFWPGLPLSLTIPRTTRYTRILLNNASVPGDPAIGGQVAVRASLAEVAQLAATPGTTSLVKGIATASLGSQTVVYATFGLKAVTLRFNATLGTSGEMILYTSNAPTGPWALVTFREQNIQGFYNSIARTLGQLDAYLRVDILDIAGGGVQGTLAASIQESPDLTAYLQNMFSALGDTGQPVNVGQSIYHRLGQIHLDVDGVEGLLGTSNTNTSNTFGAVQVVNTTLGVINGHVDDLETLITATNAKLDTLIAAPDTGMTQYSISVTIVVANTWQTVGPVFTPGVSKIDSIMVSYIAGPAMNAATAAASLATGTSASPIAQFIAISGVQPEGVPIVHKIGNAKGILTVPAGHTHLWFLSASAGTVISITLFMRT